MFEFVFKILKWLQHGYLGINVITFLGKPKSWKKGLLVHVGVASVTVHKIKCKTISSV